MHQRNLGFLEWCNEIYPHLNAQYAVYCTVKCAYISLKFQNQYNLRYIHWLSYPFNLRCESGTYTPVYNVSRFTIQFNVCEWLKVVYIFSILLQLQEVLSIKHCIVFSPSEYRKAYCDKDNCANSASVLKALRHVNWTSVRSYPKEWQNPLLQHCICSGTCFTK